MGDEIMFGSMLKEFRGWCDRLVVQMDRRLIPLFRRSLPGDVEFVERGVRVSEDRYDCHIPMGSLGRYLRLTRESFKASAAGYLEADLQRVSEIRARLGLLSGERLIGVSWRSVNPETGAGRSVPLWELAKVLGGEGRRLVSLQYGEVFEDIREAFERTGVKVETVEGLDTRDDLDGLAALITVCDVVVSIGNATAHLAGALGKQTRVLLPYAPSWRWMAEGDSSPWYARQTLFRQHAPLDWTLPLGAAATDLV